MVAVEIRPGGSRAPARRVTRSAGHANARQRELDAFDDEIAGRPSVSGGAPDPSGFRDAVSRQEVHTASGMPDDREPGRSHSVTSRSGRREVAEEAPGTAAATPHVPLGLCLAEARGEEG